MGVLPGLWEQIFYWGVMTLHGFGALLAKIAPILYFIRGWLQITTTAVEIGL